LQQIGAGLCAFWPADNGQSVADNFTRKCRGKVQFE
jgi:hypothetical protein